MIKQLFLLVLLIQPCLAMESTVSEQPSKKEQYEALEKYKQQRESFFCGMWFFNQDDSELKKESYFEIFKSLYHAHKREACIGCSICLAGTATVCSTTPFVCNQDFCYAHPVEWLFCCLVQCGTTKALTSIADKVHDDFIRYCNEKRKMERVKAVEQLRPLSVKVEKVE